MNHTFDERYPPYETCVVVEVECTIVDKFLKEFNEKTGSKLNPSKHITFAARFR